MNPPHASEASSSDADNRRGPSNRPRLRGRPRKDHAPNISADIITVATELFAELGYHGTSMEAVANRAGITKRTLYVRYPDKISLFKDVATSIVENAKVPEPPDFTDLRACLTFHTENYFIISCDPAMRVIRSLGDTELQSLPELNKIGQEMTHDLGTVPIGKTIADTAHKVGTRIADPEFIATSLLDLAGGHVMRVQLLKLPSDFAAYKFAAERIVNLLIAGIEAENR